MSKRVISVTAQSKRSHDGATYVEFGAFGPDGAVERAEDGCLRNDAGAGEVVDVTGPRHCYCLCGVGREGTERDPGVGEITRRFFSSTIRNSTGKIFSIEGEEKKNGANILLRIESCGRSSPSTATCVHQISSRCKVLRLVSRPHYSPSST